MIQNLIYERIANVAGSSVVPLIGTENTVLPVVIYTINLNDGGVTLNGPSGLCGYDLTLDIWAATFEETLEIAAECTPLLHCWSDRSIGLQGCFLQSSSQQIEEVGFHIVQSYLVWCDCNLLYIPSSSSSSEEFDSSSSSSFGE